MTCRPEDEACLFYLPGKIIKIAEVGSINMKEHLWAGRHAGKDALRKQIWDALAESGNAIGDPGDCQHTIFTTPQERVRVTTIITVRSTYLQRQLHVKFPRWHEHIRIASPRNQHFKMLHERGSS